MGVSRKRKKELRKLQDQASRLWDAQQVLVGEAATVAREAGRQLGNYGREQVAPAVQANYDRYAAPYVERGMKLSKHLLEDKFVPTAGAVVGQALSAWDSANATRARLAAARGFALPGGRKAPVVVMESRKGVGAGGVIALVLGVAAAAGVLYAAWQTLRADDELWVADDPLRAPEA